MKKIVSILIFLSPSFAIFPQNKYIDSIKEQLTTAKDDTIKFGILSTLFYEYLYSYPDSSLNYVQQEILLATRTNSELALSKAYIDYTSFFLTTGNYPEALRFSLKALKLSEKLKDWLIIAIVNGNLGNIYYYQGDYENSLLYNKKAKSLIERHWTPSFKQSLYTGKDIRVDTVWNYLFILNGMADNYEKLDRPDSAIKYMQIVNDATIELNGTMDWSGIPFRFGNAYLKKGNYSAALKYYYSGISLATEQGVNADIMNSGIGLAKTFKEIGEFDSSIFYANKVIEVSKLAYNPDLKLEALNLVAGIYRLKHNADSVAKYSELIIASKDSLFSQKKVIQLQSLWFDEQLRQQELVQQQQELTNKIKLYSLLAALGVFLVIASILYRNNRQKQKAKLAIEKAYEELKSTQAQLIQSEKMASLGELTAGIAHEIQNPLNFVNNFSEVNTELINEMKQEIDKGNYEEVKVIANDIDENQQKINHHGKRADGIVKGMLQHSRSSSGIKEPTDINTLADEHLRLAYHGLRAKDKSFNATMKTDFDESIGNINIIPQDIGRVILNLINNAFYAAAPPPPEGGISDSDKSRIPTVWVSTKKVGDKVLISVKDNGKGIPQKILDKIFQPFFTTKPTGQGTGLGLSLAYDIIKAHGGELKVETEEGEGVEFIIELPIK